MLAERALIFSSKHAFKKIQGNIFSMNCIVTASFEIVYEGGVYYLSIVP